MNQSRELRLHRWALAGMAALLGFLLLSGAAPKPPREVSLERLALVDASGRKVAVLESAEAGPQLVLFDRQDRPRLEVALRGDVPAVTLRQADGTVRLGLTSEPRGTGLAVLDEAGRPRTEMRVVDGHPEVFLRDERGRARVGLTASTKNSGMLLYDEKTRPRATFGLSGEEARLVLKDPQEAQRVVLQAGPPGRTGIQLLDPRERPVWEERERKAP